MRYLCLFGKNFHKCTKLLGSKVVQETVSVPFCIPLNLLFRRPKKTNSIPRLLCAPISFNSEMDDTSNRNYLSLFVKRYPAISSSGKNFMWEVAESLDLVGRIVEQPEWMLMETTSLPLNSNNSIYGLKMMEKHMINR